MRPVWIDGAGTARRGHHALLRGIVEPVGVASDAPARPTSARENAPRVRLMAGLQRRL
jgi:hypothetical protein